jgi:hypothetical protein
MNEPWLRDLEGAWIPSPQKQSMYDLLVSDLMLPNAKMWDKGKIESLFPMHVASRISEVPLFDMLEDDKLVWVDSSNGHYNVRSGYKLFLNITGRLVHASQNENWSSLWNIAAPLKLSIFYGDFARVVYRLVRAYKINMFRVLQYVRYVTLMMKPSCMFYLIVLLACRFGIMQDWEIYFCVVYKMQRMYKLLSMQSAHTKTRR